MGSTSENETLSTEETTTGHRTRQMSPLVPRGEQSGSCRGCLRFRGKAHRLFPRCCLPAESYETRARVPVPPSSSLTVQPCVRWPRRTIFHPRRRGRGSCRAPARTRSPSCGKSGQQRVRKAASDAQRVSRAHAWIIKCCLNMSVNSLLTSLLCFGRQCTKRTAIARCYASVAANPVDKDGIKPKTGILMLNMGGPSNTDQVHEYLLRIMTDRDMIQLPVQSKLGPWIAKRRTPEVQKKYSEIGGGSPILQWTNKQGELLCKKLDKISPETAPHKYYVAFRYTDPLTEDTLEKIHNDGVQHIVLFSQYPQYSCSTSGSSFNAIYNYYKTRELPNDMKWSIIDRWATHPLLVKTFVERIKEELAQFPNEKRDDVIILFSAHSLPLQVVNRGDSYPAEVGATVSLVMQELNYCNPYSLVWQSKVGPTAWLGPFTDEALKGYVKQGKKHFILVPIAFVNEHIETLHELDIEYCRELAEELGIERIRRAAAPNDHPIFIDALTDIVVSHLRSKQSVNPKFLTRCPHCVNLNCDASKKWYAKICKN